MFFLTKLPLELIDRLPCSCMSMKRENTYIPIDAVLTNRATCLLYGGNLLKFMGKGAMMALASSFVGNLALKPGKECL